MSDQWTRLEQALTDEDTPEAERAALAQLYADDPAQIAAALAALIQRPDLLPPEFAGDDQAREIVDQLLDYVVPPSELDLNEGIFSPPPNDTLPADFDFPLYDEADIPIRPSLNSQQFQTWEDAPSYAVPNGALFHAGLLKLAPFRSHSKYVSRFRYRLDEPTPDAPTEVAVFADFGNGLYASRYVAKQIAHRRHPYAVHLGDVYYKGSDPEFRRWFEEPLARVLPSTELFMLTGNHELYTRGWSFLRCIDQKRNDLPNQRQEGSYFRLVSKKFQIIGAETEWHRHGRMDRDHVRLVRRWLKWGRKTERMNVLMTSYHGFDYGDDEPSKLCRKDLDEVLVGGALVDLWFWGNVHHGALYEPTDEWPFVGVCAGHGGYPYYTQEAKRPAPVPVRFIETRSRFGPEHDARKEVGNNGYCVLGLREDGAADLTFIGWRGEVRHTARVERRPGERARFVAGV